jgi:alkylated DNA repair dioxygenase AlkB
MPGCNRLEWCFFPGMELFGNDAEANLLPYDGVVRYLGPVFGAGELPRIFQELWDEVAWARDELVMFGKRVTTSRKVAWYGDAPFAYAYSGTCKQALPWNPVLRGLKERAEVLAGTGFNSCLLNFYHHGGEGMGWHSDDEKSLVAGACIASMSFGAARKFSFRHKSTREVVSLVLDNGSLLLMEGETQKCWQHALPKTARVAEPRINLTFRRMADARA